MHRVEGARFQSLNLWPQYSVNIYDRSWCSGREYKRPGSSGRFPTSCSTCRGLRGPPHPAGLTLTLRPLLVARSADSLTECGANLQEAAEDTS